MASKKGSKKGPSKKSSAKKPAASKSNKVQVLIEMRVSPGTPGALAMAAAGEMQATGFVPDPDFPAIPMGSSGGGGLAADSSAANDTIIVRGTVDEDKIQDLESNPNVVKVYKDTPIAPFRSAESDPAGGSNPSLQPTPAMGTCPIPPCDCTFGNPANGNIAAVAAFLGADQVWAAGFRGDGTVIGIVDGGIRAFGRTIVPSESTKPKLDRVIGGWPTATWGTTAAAWGDHGMMCGTDALGMAPNAQLYDLRISSGSLSGTISNAIAAFQWAINQHKLNGTPQVLSNSWGIFQESWDAVYARDPSHPFTRKVVEALDEGILVLFAAGNCGGTCPDGRCGPDNGPGRSIWGANSHPRVITVGAVNINERFVGYSSQGPGALDSNKPDFCSVTHFAGYFPTVSPAGPSDGGTSAATPIAAGVVALLKQAKPSATQDQIKDAIKKTCKDIGPAGFDQHSGSGILRAKHAFDHLKKPIVVKPLWKDIPIRKRLIDDIGKRLRDEPFKRINDTKIIGRDIRDIFPRGDLPRLGAEGSPFGLATPHHADLEGSQLEMTVMEYQIALSSIEQAIFQTSLELAQLQQQYESLQAQFQAIASQLGEEAGYAGGESEGEA